MMTERIGIPGRSRFFAPFSKAAPYDCFADGTHFTQKL